MNYLRVKCTDFFMCSVFSEIGDPLLGTNRSKVEVSLLGRINQGEIFPCALKFKHAVLVDICDVFEII